MSQISDTIKSSLRAGVEIACRAVVASAAAALPILKLPLISFVFNWIVTWVAGKLLPFIETLFVDIAIDIKVNAEKVAYEKAREELQVVLKQTVKSAKAVQNASDEFDKRLADLIRIRP